MTIGVCSAPMISINADKTRAVKKTKSNRKRDREASRISVRRVTKLFRRKKYSSRLKNLMKHNFPSSSLIRNFCSNYKKCFFWCTSEHFYCKCFFHKQTERKKNKSIALVNRKGFQLTCFKQSLTSIAIALLIIFFNVQI